MNREYFEADISRFGLGRTGFVKLNDDTLFAIGNNNNQLYSIVSDDNGRSWKDKRPLIHKDNNPITGRCNYSIIRLQSGKIAVQFCRTDISLNQEDHGMFLITSDDEGKTWSQEYRINLSGNRAWPYCDVLIQTRSGRLILPVRYCFAGKESEKEKGSSVGRIGKYKVLVAGHAHYPEIDIAVVYYSDDEGHTWQMSENEIITWLDSGKRGAYAVDEPMIAETNNGNLLMFARSTVGRVVESISDDNGVSWSKAEPNSLCNSYSPVSLRRIPGTGDLHCVWNNVTADEIRKGYRRSRLCSAISKDDGQKWEHFKTLDCADTLDKKAPQQCGKIGFVISKKNCGRLPANFCIYRYPVVRYIDNIAYIMYDRETFKYPGCPARQRILRAIPIELLYTDDTDDLCLPNDTDEFLTQKIRQTEHIED